jgi:hypothetical protein
MKKNNLKQLLDFGKLLEVSLETIARNEESNHAQVSENPLKQAEEERQTEELVLGLKKLNQEHLERIQSGYNIIEREWDNS